MSTNIMTDDPLADDLPPHDDAAERSVLGGMMLSADVIAEIVDSLPGSDFYSYKHQAIYDAIVTLFAQGQPADAVTVSAELDRRGDLLKVGGAPYLHTLLATVPTAANAAYYAEIVADKAVDRRIIEAGQSITQLGQNKAKGGDSGNMLDRAQAALDAVTADGAVRSSSCFVGDFGAELLTHVDDIQAGRIPPGLSTGHPDLDKLTGGLKPGQLIIVAGRPGSGKSTLGVDIARHTSIPEVNRDTKPEYDRKELQTALVVSLEMARMELGMRILCAESRVRHNLLKTPGALSPSDGEKLQRAMRRVEQAPLVIDDTSSATLTQIRAKARRVKAAHGLALVVVDYIQLMTGTGRAESRQVEVAEFSRGLKVLARELEVPIIALAQLNRAAEMRADKRPMMSDLRESGAIEQDADMIIMVHRPELYGDESRQGEADLILAKHRGGETGTVTVAQQLHYCQFGPLAAA